MRTSHLALCLALAGCQPGVVSAPLDAEASTRGTDAGPPTGYDAGATPGTDAGPGPIGDAGSGAVDAGSVGPGTDGCAAVAPPNDERWTVTHDGLERAFFVHLPPGYAPGTPTPVVIDLHGRMSNAGQQMLVSGMKDAADANGFIAVHPEGVGGTWNGGLCCGEAMSSNIDDVGFVRALLDELAARACVDQDRVFATGLSNGGFMAHRVACELSDRIAAVAPVAGPNALLSCSPSRPVSVLHFHGTADRIVRYDGFAGQLAVRPTMEDWASRNGCAGSSSVYSQVGDVTCEEWPGCDEGTSVRLCTIEGGGHQWPGGMTLPVAVFGENTSDISATDAMWEFFVAHPR